MRTREEHIHFSPGKFNRSGILGIVYICPHSRVFRYDNSLYGSSAQFRGISTAPYRSTFGCLKTRTRLTRHSPTGFDMTDDARIVSRRSDAYDLKYLAFYGTHEVCPYPGQTESGSLLAKRHAKANMRAAVRHALEPALDARAFRQSGGMARAKTIP